MRLLKGSFLTDDQNDFTCRMPSQPKKRSCILLVASEYPPSARWRNANLLSTAPPANTSGNSDVLITVARTDSCGTRTPCPCKNSEDHAPPHNSTCSQAIWPCSVMTPLI